MEWISDFSSDAGVHFFNVLRKILTRTLSHLFYQTPLTSDIPIQVLAFILWTFIDARITRIRKDTTLITVQQLMRHNHIMNMGGLAIAGNSRPDLKALASPKVATEAVAVSRPTPGISAIAFADDSPFFHSISCC